MYAESVKLENIRDKRWALLKSRETGRNISFLDILLCRVFAIVRGSCFKTSCSFHQTLGPPKSHGTFCFLTHRLPSFHSQVQLLSQLFLESFRDKFWGQKLASGSRNTQPHMEYNYGLCLDRYFMHSFRGNYKRSFFSPPTLFWCYIGYWDE